VLPPGRPSPGPLLNDPTVPGTLPQPAGAQACGPTSVMTVTSASQPVSIRVPPASQTVVSPGI